MLENIMSFFKKTRRREALFANSKDAAKERLQLVLMQDRANVSADFLDLMREEIIEVIKKYIDIDEEAMDVRLTNKENEDGTQGAPALYANIHIVNIKDETRKLSNDKKTEENIQEKSKDDKNVEENKEIDNSKDDDKIKKDEIDNSKEEVTNKKKDTDQKKENIEESNKENKNEE